jgi:hypothetical protein
MKKDKHDPPQVDQNNDQCPQQQHHQASLNPKIARKNVKTENLENTRCETTNQNNQTL